MGVVPEPPCDLSRVAWGGYIGPFAGKAEGLNFSSTGHFSEWVVVSRSLGTDSGLT